MGKKFMLFTSLLVLLSGCEGVISESTSNSFGKVTYKINRLSDIREVTELSLRKGEEIEFPYEVSSDNGSQYLKVALEVVDNEDEMDDYEYVWEKEITQRNEKGIITFVAPKRGEYEVLIENINAKFVKSTDEGDFYEGLPPSENIVVKADISKVD